MPACVGTAAVEVSPGVVVQTLTFVSGSPVDLSTCPLVVETGVEYAAAQASPFALTSEEGVLISAGLISCWLAAYGIRSIIQIIKGSSE